MNLAIYHFAAGTQMGGGKPVFSRQISQALAERCDVTLYTDGPVFDYLRDSAVDVVELPEWPENSLHHAVPQREPTRLKSSLSYLNARRNGLKKHLERQDLFLTHKWYEDIVVSRTTDAPVVYQRHSIGDKGIGGRIHDLLATSDWKIVNSEPVKRAHERTRGVDIDGIVRPGVDPERFHPDVAPAFEADEPVILFVGRFEAIKGVETLLEAFGPLADCAQLMYLGDGSKRDTLTQRARSLGISESVEVGDVISHRQIASYYAAADIACHPSRYEGFGLTNLEAMATGVPLITTPFGVVKEFGVDGETHVEVRPDDPESLTMELKRLLEHPKERMRLGKNAHEMSKGHSWDQRAEKLLSLSEEFLNQND